jgi:hypothetical protein
LDRSLYLLSAVGAVFGGRIFTFQVLDEAGAQDARWDCYHSYTRNGYKGTQYFPDYRYRVDVLS